MKLTKNYIRSLIKEELTEEVKVPKAAKDTLTYLSRIVDRANFEAFWASALPRLLQPPSGVSPASIKTIMLQAWPKGGSAAYTALMGEDTEGTETIGGDTEGGGTQVPRGGGGGYDTGN